MYGYFLAYLTAPGTFDSAHVLEVISGLSEAAKYSAKVILATPFAFHTFNGIRHLSWDIGKCTSDDVSIQVLITDFPQVLTLKSSYQAGYAVLVATVVSTVALVSL
jgi:succinate dehydrogenase (ubiquinone) cytochrome b560 subunit